jgi:hypothetical protein
MIQCTVAEKYGPPIISRRIVHEANVVAVLVLPSVYLKTTSLLESIILNEARIAAILINALNIYIKCASHLAV